MGRVSPERAEPASSTTTTSGAPPPPPPQTPPGDWSVEDVIGFIAAADQALAAHADLFRKHVRFLTNILHIPEHNDCLKKLKVSKMRILFFP